MKRLAFSFFVPAFALGLGISLFGSLMPLPLEGYTTQRILLCIYLVIFAVFGSLIFSGSNAIERSSSFAFVFCFISSLVFLTNSFFFEGRFHFVEPIMYALFVMAVFLAGEGLAKTSKVSEISVSITVVSIGGAFLYSGLTINYYIFSILNANHDISSVIPWGFVNVRYWSHLATWLLPLFPLALVVVSWRKNGLWRVAVFFSAAIWIWLAILSEARGTLISLAIAVVVALLVFRRRALPWTGLMALFALFGGVAWLLLSLILPSLIYGELESVGLRLDSSGRVVMWREALAMSLVNFPWGMGAQSWLTHATLTEAYAESRQFAHPHNMYLMWAAEYGWILIMSLALLGVTVSRLLLKRAQALAVPLTEDCRTRSMVLVALTASVVAALCHAFFSAVFIAPASMLVGLFVMTLFWACLRPSEELQASSRLPRMGKVKDVCFALTLVLVSTVWLKEVFAYYAAMQEDLGYYKETVQLNQSPRFWLHGFFPRNEALMPKTPE